MKKLLAMVLALVMTLSLAVSANAFKDDKSISDDYAEAVAVLNGMGVFKGYEDGSFKPEGNITRAEVATIVYRIDTQMFFFHGFYNHSLELRRILFVWYSFWHSKTPHLLDSISYCLTNGVLFGKSVVGCTFQCKILRYDRNKKALPKQCFHVSQTRKKMQGEMVQRSKITLNN